jgi:DNA-binding protein WhiA
MFEVYNARIEGEIRSNENRATNCVARNIQKSVAASARHMDAIGRLMEKGKLDSLPEALRETALLRYRNPDATLDELKNLHHPPISKSGLSHRLQKLLDESEE